MFPTGLKTSPIQFLPEEACGHLGLNRFVHLNDEVYLIVIS